MMAKTETPVDPSSAISGARQGSRAQPYERLDGVKTQRWTATVSVEFAKEERVFCAQLDPEWTRTDFIQAALRYAMQLYREGRFPPPTGHEQDK